MRSLLLGAALLHAAYAGPPAVSAYIACAPTALLVSVCPMACPHVSVWMLHGSLFRSAQSHGGRSAVQQLRPCATSITCFCLCMCTGYLLMRHAHGMTALVACWSSMTGMHWLQAMQRMTTRATGLTCCGPSWRARSASCANSVRTRNVLNSLQIVFALTNDNLTGFHKACNRTCSAQAMSCDCLQQVLDAAMPALDGSLCQNMYGMTLSGVSLNCAAGEAGSTAAAVIANCVPALPELEFRSFATLNAGAPFFLYD